MDRRFILILVALFLVAGGVFFFTKNHNSNKSSSSNGTVGTTSSHSKGAGTAGVELVEYGDFQCPICGQFYPLVSSVLEKYGDQVKFTYRHFPLDSIHPNARAAHRAAESAGKQGKFFEMYDLLYQNQQNWSSLSNPVTVFNDYASQLGLKLDVFQTDFASQTVNNTINADIQQGKDTYQVSGTPTFVINGKKVENSQVGSVDAFSKQIDAAIAEAAKTTPKP